MKLAVFKVKYLDSLVFVKICEILAHSIVRLIFIVPIVVILATLVIIFSRVFPLA